MLLLRKISFFFYFLYFRFIYFSISFLFSQQFPERCVAATWRWPLTGVQDGVGGARVELGGDLRRGAQHRQRVHRSAERHLGRQRAGAIGGLGKAIMYLRGLEVLGLDVEVTFGGGYFFQTHRRRACPRWLLLGLLKLVASNDFSTSTENPRSIDRRNVTKKFKWFEEQPRSPILSHCSDLRCILELRIRQAIFMDSQVIATKVEAATQVKNEFVILRLYKRQSMTLLTLKILRRHL